MKQPTLFSMVNSHTDKATSDATLDTKGRKQNEVKSNGNGNSGEENVKPKPDKDKNASKGCKCNNNNGSVLALDSKKEMISYEDFIHEEVKDQSKKHIIHDLMMTEQDLEVTEGRSLLATAGTVKNDTVMQDKSDSCFETVEDENVSSCKQSMSYRDFLGMFKPASSACNGGVSKVILVDDEDHGIQPKVDNDDDVSEKLTITDRKEATSTCKSIASYFKPSLSKIKGSSSCAKDNQTSITVTAEVHSLPPHKSGVASKKLKLKKEKCSTSQNKGSKAKSFDSDGIIHLESETITINCSPSNSEQGTRKRKFENETQEELPEEANSKKKKSSHSKDNDASKKGNSFPPSTQLGQSRLCFGTAGLTITKQQLEVMTDEHEPAPSSSNESKINKKTEFQMETEIEKSFTNSVSGEQPSNKIKHPNVGQETEMGVSEVVANELASVEEPAYNSLNELKINRKDKQIETEINRSVTRKSSSDEIGNPDVVQESEMNVSKSVSSANESEVDLQQCEQMTKETDVTQKQGRLRLRNRKLVDQQDNVTVMKDKKATKFESDQTSSSVDVEIVNDEGTTTSTPSRRRSSRIKQIEEKKAEEIIELDDSIDDIIVEAEQPKDKKNQKSCKNAEQSPKKTDMSENKKVPRGKLAPIFTRLKPSEVEIVKPPSPTPQEMERIRARQEFLMSGIPDSLKQAKAASDLQAVCEYPPFPCPSHVQQYMEDESCHVDSAGINYGLHQMRSAPGNNEIGIEDQGLSWARLEWKKLDAKVYNPEKLLFENFSSHPRLSKQASNMLLKDVQERDQAFPFKEAFDLFSTAQANDVPSSADTDDDVIVVDDSPHPPSKAFGSSKTNSSSINGVLWTDEQPRNSEFIIGNDKLIKQLRDWLKEWHVEFQKEAKKAMKGHNKSHNSSKRKEWLNDDSDFTDSSEEDMRLCNTMLITGPHGVGKTSAVYCLAQELGFKIFEVNPTSLRSGKQLQSQLEEATQSHRVVQRSNPGSTMIGTPPPGTLKEKAEQVKKKPSANPVSKAFSGFFKKVDSTKPENGKKEKVSKRKDVEVIASPKAGQKRSRKKKDIDDAKPKEQLDGIATDRSNPLNITSASIILFDEADIVLEEDKGFLSTVQNFMSFTKVPIIITSTNPTIHQDLSPRHEHIIFKHPPLKNLSNFLHTVCLTKGVRVSPSSLLHLASVLKRDVRQCLLFIQFWCESGGGRYQVESSDVSNIAESCATVHAEYPSSERKDGISSCDNSKDIEFLSLRPARKRQKRMVLVDEDSSSNSSTASANNSKSEINKRVAMTTKKEVVDLTMESGARGTVNCLPDLPIPNMHFGCEVSLMGTDICSDSLNLFFVDLIKRSHVQDLTEAINKINHTESYLCCQALYNLAIQSCSLKKIAIPSTCLKISEPKSKILKKKRRRIMTGDWLDSDGSGDDEKKCEEDKCVAKDEVPLPSCLSGNDVDKDETDKEQSVKNDVQNQFSGAESEMQSNASLISKENRTTSMLTWRLLDSFSGYYETNSCVQSFYSRSGLLDGEYDSRCISPGVSDEDVLYSDHDTAPIQNLSREICGAVELLSARTFVKRIDHCLKKGNKTEEGYCDDDSNELFKGVMEEMHVLPIGTKTPDIWFIGKSHSDKNIDSVVKNVTSSLGSGVQGSGFKDSLHLDYMPVLREICRGEQERQAANMKRRFIHYLDHSGLNLKESTITSLATMYSIAE